MSSPVASTTRAAAAEATTTTEDAYEMTSIFAGNTTARQESFDISNIHHSQAAMSPLVAPITGTVPVPTSTTGSSTLDIMSEDERTLHSMRASVVQDMDDPEAGRGESNDCYWFSRGVGVIHHSTSHTPGSHFMQGSASALGNNTDEPTLSDEERLRGIKGRMFQEVAEDLGRTRRAVCSASVSGVSSGGSADKGTSPAVGVQGQGVVLDLLADHEHRDMVFDCASTRFDAGIFCFQFVVRASSLPAPLRPLLSLPAPCTPISICSCIFFCFCAW